MTFFCLIESDNPPSTHMEVLDAETSRAAKEEARVLVAQHSHAVRAHVFTADAAVATLHSGELAAT